MKKNVRSFSGFYIFLTMLFFLVLAIRPINAFADSRTDTFDAKSSKITLKNSINVTDSWKIELTNSTKNTAVFTINSTYEKVGSLSSMPGIDVEKEEFKLGGEEKEWAVKPGETAIVTVEFWNYPLGNGYYDVTVSLKTKLLTVDKNGVIPSWHPCDEKKGHSWIDGRCHWCDSVCTHKKTAISYTPYKEIGSHTKHFKRKHCVVCDYTFSNIEEKCTNGKYVANTDTTHKVYCKYCKEIIGSYSLGVSCIKNSKTFKKYQQYTVFEYKGTYHLNVYKCYCGNTVKLLKKHRFSSGKCKDCGFKKATVGNLTNVSFAQKGTADKWVYNRAAYWSGGKYYPAKKYNKYDITFNLSFKKPSSVYKVKVEFDGYDTSMGSNCGANPTGGLDIGKSTYDKITTLTSFKNMKFTNGYIGTDITVTITPYAKNGTVGKIIKKKFKSR